MPVEVKICGITNGADARQALAAGADYLGCVLYPKSVRGIDLAALCRIADAVGPGAALVGVFVSPAPEDVLAAVQAAGLIAAQLHGPCEAAAFAGFPVPLWRAVTVSAGQVAPSPVLWPQAERLVADAHVPGLYGGSGQRADWNRASQLAQTCRMMLAGGLNPDNVCAAIEAVRPLGVDVASGVEAAPGQKDHAAVERFIRAAKGM